MDGIVFVNAVEMKKIINNKKGCYNGIDNTRAAT